MKLKRGTVVLVVIALLLVATAIAVNALGEKNVPTQSDLKVNAGGGEVGVTVLPNNNVEDKLAGKNLG